MDAGDSMRSRTMAAPYWIVGLAAAIIHTALLILDAASVDGFWRADRASQRFHAMRNLIESSHDYSAFIACLVKQGILGDYGLHAVLYSIGGPMTVIMFQVLLAMAAALCVTYISWRAFHSKNIAVMGGMLYVLLPQTIAFPHQLLSESISNPFLIFGTAGVLHALERPRNTWSWALAGLSMGIAGFVRPALILLPLVAAGLLVWLDRARLRSWQTGIFALSGLLPFLLWGIFMLIHTGKFGPGQSTQDLGLNFSQSTAKVLLSEGVAQANGSAPDWLPARLTLGEYLHYVGTHPKGFANLYLKNTLVMLSDSGIGRLYVDLLGIGAKERIRLQDPVFGWRAQLTNHGPLSMLKQGWSMAPGTISAGVLGAAGFALVNIGMLFAYVALLRRNSPLTNPTNTLQQRWCLAFLLVIPIYVLGTSQAVAYAPSRLRSQGEFAWALLACFGWAHLWNSRRRAADT
jgi:4-amino-4-deoxy-L-arabinose transferase-like glycosyltransferase